MRRGPGRQRLVRDDYGLVLGIDEDEEVVSELLHSRQGVLFEHRLDGETLGLDDSSRRSLRLIDALGLLGGECANPRLLGPDFAARLLTSVYGLALDAVDDGVQAGLERRPSRMTAQNLTAGRDRHVSHLRVGNTPMLLAGQFDDRVRFVIEQSFEPAHLAFRILPDLLRDVDVLALDDRPHKRPPQRKIRAGSASQRPM